MMRREGLSPFISVPDTIAELLAAGASVPFGASGLIHVWGKNDMTTHQMVGMLWVVTDPDGYEVAGAGYGPDWEGMTAGEEDDFIGGRFDLNKKGTWNIAINLLMNQASPVVVDSYNGVLCVVEEEVYAGHITRKELEYDSVRGDIPVL